MTQEVQGFHNQDLHNLISKRISIYNPLPLFLTHDVTQSQIDDLQTTKWIRKRGIHFAQPPTKTNNSDKHHDNMIRYS